MAAGTCIEMFLNYVWKNALEMLILYAIKQKEDAWINRRIAKNDGYLPGADFLCILVFDC